MDAEGEMRSPVHTEGAICGRMLLEGAGARPGVWGVGRRATKKAASAGECCLMLGRGGDYSHSIVALGFGDIS